MREQMVAENEADITIDTEFLDAGWRWMKKNYAVLISLTVILLMLSGCAGTKETAVPNAGSNPAKGTQTEIKPDTAKSEAPKTEASKPTEDTTKYSTGIWNKAKMNNLEPPKADLTAEVQDTGVVKYMFMNIKKVNAENYVKYLKDNGYTTSPVEMSSTSYRAAKNGYEVIFSCSDFNSEGIGSGQIQMVKKN